MRTWRIPLKLVMTGAMWGTLAYALLLGAVSALLQPWHIVEQVGVGTIRLLYGFGFPPIAAVLYSQIFAADVEEHTLQWIRSLPKGRLSLFLERWVFGTVIMLAFYFVSLWMVDWFVLPLPWGIFSFEVLVPSLLLGQLGMLFTLIGKQTVVGMAVPLLYWVFEAVSRGAGTGELYLFTAAFGAEPAAIAENRAALLAFAGSVWVAAAIMMHSRYHNRR